MAVIISHFRLLHFSMGEDSSYLGCHGGGSYYPLFTLVLLIDPHKKSFSHIFRSYIMDCDLEVAIKLHLIELIIWLILSLSNSIVPVSGLMFVVFIWIFFKPMLLGTHVIDAELLLTPPMSLGRVIFLLLMCLNNPWSNLGVVWQLSGISMVIFVVGGWCSTRPSLRFVKTHEILGDRDQDHDPGAFGILTCQKYYICCYRWN